MEEILLIDKPKGITSFDVIQRLRKKLSITKIGHAGTLDPNATGLLVIGVGGGTKKLKGLVGLDKEYLAEILLGVKTDSGDITGVILEEKSVNSVPAFKLQTALRGISGIHVFAVSKFSATKIGGVPAYKLARKGKRVPNLKREMEVKDIEIINSEKEGDHWLLSIRLTVTSGTYIRSIAEEIGRILEIPATLKNLRRTRVGNFDVADADTELLSI